MVVTLYGGRINAHGEQEADFNNVHNFVIFSDKQNLHPRLMEMGTKLRRENPDCTGLDILKEMKDAVVFDRFLMPGQLWPLKNVDECQPFRLYIKQHGLIHGPRIQAVFLKEAMSLVAASLENARAVFAKKEKQPPEKLVKRLQGVKHVAEVVTLMGNSGLSDNEKTHLVSLYLEPTALTTRLKELVSKQFSVLMEDNKVVLKAVEWRGDAGELIPMADYFSAHSIVAPLAPPAKATTTESSTTTHTKPEWRLLLLKPNFWALERLPTLAEYHGKLREETGSISAIFASLSTVHDKQRSAADLAKAVNMTVWGYLVG